MRAVVVDPRLIGYRSAENIADQTQQMLAIRKLWIAQNPNIHLMRFGTMPSIPTVAAKCDARSGKQDPLPRLALLSSPLKGGGNLAGGLRAARKGVVEGKSVSVRVDLGGGRIIKKKNQTVTS